MSEQKGTWTELFAGSGLKVWVFAGGVVLQSLEVFIVSTLMPSVVKDIGGLDVFAWNTTLFIVASILASVFAAVRPFGIGSRGTYLLAAALFGLGSLIAGLAPSIWWLLAGRTVQGFGAGLLVAMTYAMIRLVFPERLWARAMALTSAAWGVSTLLGPAVGGIFAQMDFWRGAFLVMVPLSIVLALGAVRVLPRQANAEVMVAMPIPQIGLVVASVLAISLASVLTDQALLATALLIGAALAMIALGVIDRRARQRLFPTGTFAMGSGIGPLFLAMVLLQTAVVSDIFAPFFLQRLHGLGPLAAGYMVAFVSLGWSVTSMTVAGWDGNAARRVIALGAPIMFAGMVALALLLPAENHGADLGMLAAIAVAFFAIGVGVGANNQKLTERVLSVTPMNENNLTSATLSMVQLFSAGLGAALSGLVVNAGGLPQAAGPSDLVAPAQWLYWLFALLPALAIPLVLAIARSGPSRPVALPAE